MYRIGTSVQIINKKSTRFGDIGTVTKLLAGGKYEVTSGTDGRRSQREASELQYTSRAVAVIKPTPNTKKLTTAVKAKADAKAAADAKFTVAPEVGYNMGDRVVCLDSHDSKSSIVGETGTVKYTGAWGNPGVEFDRHISGHNGDGKRLDGHCWAIPANKLAPASKMILTVASDGYLTQATLAVNGVTIKTAEAKYNPDDAAKGLPYKFETGAQYAVDRLLTGVARCDMTTTAEQTPAVEPPKPVFQPYLLAKGKRFGTIGKLTEMTDIVGRTLSVGDVVEMFKADGTSGGLLVAAQDVKHGAFLMCASSLITDKSPVTGKVFKVRGYEDVAHREEVAGVKYCKELK